MRPDRFRAFATEALAKAPDVQSVETWEGRRSGLHITFTTGAQLWLGMTGALAPGEKHEHSEAPVHGKPPAEVPWPELYEGGKVTPSRAKHYLAAVITNSGNDEIDHAAAYDDQNQNPGFGVTFHNGAKAFCLFTQTARAGQSAGSRDYELQADF